MINYKVSTFDRFMEHVDTTGEGESDCWIWKRCRSLKAYGAFTLKRGVKAQPAHRVSYRLFVSAFIPAGLFVLHRCDNMRCVNPNHLFLGTASDNANDMYSKGRSYYDRLDWQREVEGQLLST